MSIVTIPYSAADTLAELRYRDNLQAKYQVQDNGPTDLDPAVGALRFNETDTVTLSGNTVREDFAGKSRHDKTTFGDDIVDVEMFQTTPKGFWRQRMHLDRVELDKSVVTVEQTNSHGP